MTPTRRKNFERLLTPRSIAVIGGRDAEVVIGECKRIGFDGVIWPVNPKREAICGIPCVATVGDLPGAPDAAFIAVPRDAAVETTRALRDIGAGGVVCYTAGFGEIDQAGRQAEEALINAAGDMALVGPNCYGVINFVNKSALWPFARGGECPGYGAAIITQSGMLSSDLTMSQRSFPFAYMISAGNQAVLGLEDYLEMLSDREEVRAIGLHVEGLRDIPKFCDAALKALEANRPVVVLKTGSSQIGSRLTESHTGSLSGTDELYQALFDRLGIIRVSSPAQMLETLKFICVAGVPVGPNVAGFTCSGGGATMLADHAEKTGLEFPQPSNEASLKLQSLLPATATVSNPLDYTTPIWGDAERVPPVMGALLAEQADASIIVQDFPLPGLDESKQYYLNDTLSFVAETQKAGVPAAVCSTLPENLDKETRDMLVAKGVAPMQGIGEAIEAMAGAVRFGQRRRSVLDNGGVEAYRLVPAPVHEQATLVDEWQSKAILKSAGISVPEGLLAGRDNAGEVAEQLAFPLTVKMVSNRLVHKTDVGAVKLNLNSAEAVREAVVQMAGEVGQRNPDGATDSFLLEQMVGPPVAELLVGVRCDLQFGLTMTLASGGVLVELLGDSATILLPANTHEINAALDRLKVGRIIDGYRGRPGGDRKALIEDLRRLAELAVNRQDQIAEIEINPLFVLANGICAVDAVIYKWGQEADTA